MMFKEIIGQQQVKERLVHSVKSGRVSHAQLFLAPEGAGGLALAIAYSQFLCCTNKNETDSCGHCPSCKKISKLIHPDLTFSFPVALIDKKKISSEFMDDWRKEIISNPYLNLNDWGEAIEVENKQPIISAEESQDIVKRLGLKSAEAEYKIVIIWLPEKMNLPAANKLLKVLEEPPDKTIFLLVSENYEQIISTILSRTQLIKINRIASVDLTEHLVNKFSLSKEEAKKLVHISQGNYNEILKLLNKKEDEQSSGVQPFVQWMRLCFKPQPQELMQWVDTMSKTGREYQKNFLSYSMELCRECLLINYNQPELLHLQEEELEKFKLFAPFVHHKNAPLFMDELNNAQRQIEGNAHPKMLFMNLSFTMNKLLQVK